MNKRTFLKNTTMLGISTLTGLSAIGKVVDAVAHMSPAETAKDDDFWQSIRGSYKLKPDYINLENGYYSIMPQEVLEAYLQKIREVNLQGSYYMRTVQYDNKYAVAAELAKLAGCEPGEVIITRNTTESLDTIISGLDWQPGDEAVMAEQDYGAMLDMFKQIAKRHNTVNKIISLPLQSKSDEEIVSSYESAITPKTKLLMVCQVVNITGQILPVRKICDMAHRHNVQVMVDGAHAFAQIKFTIPDLDCDYYGCSLHKWLSAPLGAGLLYIRKDHISKVWPLYADSSKKDDDIHRFNHTGTHPAATDLAISAAIDFYKKIGVERKEERLRYLQHYWTSKVRNMPHIVMNTPEDPARSCAIANVGIKGMKPADMAKTLLDKYKIYTVAIDNAGVHGCRITPSIFTTTAELDALVNALTEMRA